MKLFCKKKSTIYTIQYFVKNDHTKYVEVDRFLIRDKLDYKIVLFPYVKCIN